MRRVKLSEQPRWQDLPKKARVIATTALLLAIASMVGLLIRDTMGLEPLTWWVLIPFGLALCLQLYNFAVHYPQLLRTLEERDRQAAED